MRKTLLSIIVCAIILSGCGGVTPIAERPAEVTPPSQLETPPAPEILVTHPELEIISPENVTRLEEIGKWGESVIYDIAVSPDRKTIAVRTVDGIHFYDSQTLDKKGYIGSEVEYTTDLNLSIAYSPDGKYLVSSGNFGANIINLDTNEREKHIYSPIPGDSKILDVQMSPNNLYAVVTTETTSSYCDARGKNFALYDLTNESGKLIFDRYFCSPHYSHFQFTTNNRVYFFLWYATNPYPYQMDVVDLSTGMLIESVSYHYGNLDPTKTFYDISPDGKIFASAEYQDNDETTWLVDVQTGDVLQTIKGYYITFTPADDGSFTWNQRWRKPIDQTIPSCVILSNGMNEYEKISSSKNLLTLLVTNYEYLSIELWNTSQCELIKQISYSRNDRTFFNDDNHFSLDGTLYAKRNGEKLEVWDVRANQLSFIAHSSYFRFPINTFAFNSDGTRLITSTTETRGYQSEPHKIYSLDVWDTQTGLLISTIQTGEEYLSSLVTTPDPDVIAAMDSNTIAFWNIKTENKISSIPAGHFAINRDGRSVWVIPWTRNNLSLYDLMSGTKLKSMQVSDAIKIVNGFYVDPDGENCIVIFFDDDARYLVKQNLHSGTILLKVPLDDYTQEMKGQGNYFFTYGSGNVGVWNFQNDLPLHNILGASGQSFSISPDNRVLVSFSSYLQAKIRVWDTQSGNLIMEIYSSFDATNINFSPDGRLIAFGGSDGFIHVWGVKIP